MKENLSGENPSSFVLVIDGQEKRLNTGEELKLEVVTLPDHEELKSLKVTIKDDHVKMRFQYEVSFFAPEWGNIMSKMGTKEKEFKTTFSSSILLHEHDRVDIQGTDLKFNPNFTELSGKGWSLEYRPQ